MFLLVLDSLKTSMLCFGEFLGVVCGDASGELTGVLSFDPIDLIAFAML